MFKLICLIIILITNNAIIGDTKKVRLVELTNSWTLRNLNGSISVPELKIPSGVFTALKSQFGDILEAQNDDELRWIADESWIYEQTFDDDEYAKTRTVNLTFYGIDTVSTIQLNNQILGETNNMFVVHSYDVTHLLKPKGNVLQVQIQSPLAVARKRAADLLARNLTAPADCPRWAGNTECHPNLVRKQQASFGGIFTPTAPSMGIWKTVTLEYYDVGVMRDVDVAVRKNDTHWTLDVQVFLQSNMRSSFFADLTLYANELMDKPFLVNRMVYGYASSTINFQVDIIKKKVKPWWPNGYGNQKLYPLFVTVNTWTARNDSHLHARTISQKTLMIGFRTIELIEDRDSRGRTFFFKVNDVPIFIKGANYVPLHILPEHSADEDTLDRLFKSAKEMHMNMLRVWGGGLYESDLFYSKADYYGILIWQDMTFSAATYPVIDSFVVSIRRETYQNAIRLAYHPSLALIVTNNEIEWYLVNNRLEFANDVKRLEDDYKLLFVGVIRYELNIISRSDFSPRPDAMLSTPSLGIKEFRKYLLTDPQNINYGDVHIRENERDGFNVDDYPRARFISEFGYASLPTMSSWERSMGDKLLPLASIIKHRQHDPNGFTPILNLINSLLPFEYQNWEENIDKFIYLSQVAQALSAKTAVDLFRSQRVENVTMGALIWQLNDVWVAPTWSCIDFYGSYKLIYYWAREFFAPTHVIALLDAKRDGINLTLTREDYLSNHDFRSYNVTIETFVWNKLFPIMETSLLATMNSNEINRQYLKLDQLYPENYLKSEIFLRFTLTENLKVISSTFFWPVPINQIKGARDPELTVEIVNSYCPESQRHHSLNLRTTVKYPALFVYLEILSSREIIQNAKFSENGFTQVEPVKMSHLEFDSSLPCGTFTASNITVFTMNQFLL